MQDKKLWFVIQGPMKFFDDVKNSYNGFSNVIWSTWENEKGKLKNEKHKVLSNYPIVSGERNINLQVKSTLEGLKYAKKQGAQYAFKIRSDMQISDLELLVSKLKFDDTLYFPIYHTHEDGYFVDYFQFGPIDKMIKLWSIPLKFKIFHNKYPEFYLKENFLKNFKDEKVRYLIPICVQNNIKIYWLKNNVDVTEICSTDSLYTYKEFNKE